MIPKKLALGHRSEGGPRFPACAKPGLPLVTPVYASAGEARSEKIMLGQQAKAKYRIDLKSFRFSGGLTAYTETVSP
jgi:hypothetical protein